MRNTPVRSAPLRAYSRRRFLAQSVGGLAVASFTPPKMDDESYWEQVRAQFPIRPGFIFMNAGNLCPSPYAVSAVVTALTRDVDADASFQNRDKFDSMYEESLEALGRLVGADPDELVVVRNTTEGNNQVVTGLDLGPGDEVVLWDENHPSNNLAWDVRARRMEFTVKRVAVPPAPFGADDLLGVFEAALTPSTRVLAFSHVSNVTGIALPAQHLCSMARDRGILTLIDGAQTFGAHALDLHAIGCDFFTGSAHKWFMGPKEGGLLYVKRESAAQIWPAMVGVGWQEDLPAARRLGTLGQRDDAMCASTAHAVAFAESIGKKRVETRVRSLASALKSGILEHVAHARLTTPLDRALSGGVVVFSVDGWDHERVFETLYRSHDIAAAAIGGTQLRLCPHVYNTMAGVEQVVRTLATI